MNIKFDLFLIDLEQQFYMYGKSDIIVARMRGHRRRERGCVDNGLRDDQYAGVFEVISSTTWR